MTREMQKETEKRYAEGFLDGFIEYASIDNSGERPDLWIRRAPPPDVGLEVTEYHPDPEGKGRCSRVALESRWWKGLESLIERERRARPSLEGVKVRLSFKDPRLPRDKEHSALVHELIGVIEAAASHLKSSSHDVSVDFASRDTIARLGARVDDDLFLPAEDWPLAVKHLAWLTVSRWPSIEWPSMTCQDVAAAWVGPQVEKLCRILKGKADLARTYDLAGAPLWLLIVCETFGDLQSHIFPGDASEIAALAVGVEEAGFDFHSAPFNEVWLYSTFVGARCRLHPLEQETLAG